MISSNSQRASANSVTIIESSRSPWTVEWPELWRHRELFFLLAWRDVKVRYKQTVLGITWAVLQPLAVALALAGFLGRAVHIQPANLPYPVFAYAGMVLWQLFAQCLAESSNSVVGNEHLISKVYFPRLLVPVSTVLSSLLDFAISLPVLALFLIYFRIMPGVAALLFPLFVLPAIVSSLGVGFWLSALNVRFRDVRYTVNFLVQFWFFASPVAYPASAVPPRWRLLYDLNPMVGALDGFRWALHSQGSFPARSVMFSVAVCSLMLVTGFYYFRRTEDNFADFI